MGYSSRIAPMVPGSYVNDMAKIKKLDDGMNLVEYGDEVLELAGGERYIEDCGQIYRVVNATEGADNSIDELLETVSYSNKHSKGARWVQENLTEKLAMEEVLTNPSAGK